MAANLCIGCMRLSLSYHHERAGNLETDWDWNHTVLAVHWFHSTFEA